MDTPARGEADGRPPTEAALTATRALAALLDRGTRHRAVGTEHAAIASQRLKPRSAALAIIEKLASVGGHRFDGLVSALRTGQDRVKLHFDRLAVCWCGLLLDRLDLEKAFGIHPASVAKINRGIMRGGRCQPRFRYWPNQVTRVWKPATLGSLKKNLMGSAGTKPTSQLCRYAAPPASTSASACPRAGAVSFGGHSDPGRPSIKKPTRLPWPVAHGAKLSPGKEASLVR
jgi:hypothetical protein